MAYCNHKLRNKIEYQIPAQWVSRVPRPTPVIRVDKDRYIEIEEDILLKLKKIRYKQCEKCGSRLSGD